MPKKYPPLTPAEVEEILRAWGFEWVGSKGSHHRWRRILSNEIHSVTVDHAFDQFDVSLVKYLILQSG